MDNAALQARIDQLEADYQAQQDDIRTHRGALQTQHDEIANQRRTLDALDLAEAAALFARGVGAGAPGVRPRGARAPTHLTYNGRGDDWLTFKQRYEHYKNLAGYTDEQSKLALASCMVDGAARAVSHIDPANPAFNYRDFVVAYEACFMPPAASAIAQSQYERACQLPKETILEYHSRLRDLHDRAYPRQIRGDPTQLIRAFAKGIRRTQVRMQVFRGAPNTYQEALEYALREQSVQMVSGRDQDEPMDISFLDESKAVCFNCNETGHFKRNCKKSVNAVSRTNHGNRTNQVNRGGARAAKPNRGAGRGRGPAGANRQRMRRIVACLEDALDMEDAEAEEDGEEDGPDDVDEDAGQDQEAEESEDSSQGDFQ